MAESWLAAKDPRIVTTAPADPAWWLRFDDPKLADLIRIAQQQNPNLQSAGVRVLQVHAQLAATAGDLYPQKQQLFGELTYKRLSERDSSSGVARDLADDTGRRPSLLNDHSFWLTQLGSTASWELDLWGKFRRAIESADPNLSASVASYDDALVSLTAQVARAYVNIRTYEERLRIPRENAEAQRQTLRLADVRFRNGQVSETDAQQARSEYAQTRSQIPQLEIGLCQNRHALSTLLGRPPSELQDLLGLSGPIPAAPPKVAIGIPADLLRRRPHIRSAEQQAAAQSALIGATKAELYPAFSLSGTFGFLSTDIGKLGSQRRFPMVKAGRLLRSGGGLERPQLRSDHQPGAGAGCGFPGGGSRLSEHGAPGSAGGRGWAGQLPRRPRQRHAAERIGQHLVDPGNLVGSGAPTQLATIDQLAPIYVYFNFDEENVLRLRAALRAAGKTLADLGPVKLGVGLQNETGYPHEAMLDFVATDIDQGTGTLQARGVITNEDYVFLPGLFVWVQVPVGTTKDALLVADRALGMDQRGNYVLVVGKDEVVEQRPVQIGALHDGMRVIRQGLNAEDRVVIEGLQRAIPGSKVAAREAAEPPVETAPAPGSEPAPATTMPARPGAEPSAAAPKDGAAAAAPAAAPKPKPGR